MIELKDLLGRFEKILLKEEIKTDILAQALSKYAQVKINKQDITMSGDTIFLNIKPIYKSELFLHKEEIQKEIQSILGGVVSRKVR